MAVVEPFNQWEKYRNPSWNFKSFSWWDVYRNWKQSWKLVNMNCKEKLPMEQYDSTGRMKGLSLNKWTFQIMTGDVLEDNGGWTYHRRRVTYLNSEDLLTWVRKKAPYWFNYIWTEPFVILTRKSQHKHLVVEVDLFLGTVIPALLNSIEFMFLVPMYP